MYTKHRYHVVDILRWTHREIFIFAFLASIPPTIYHFFGIELLRLPWQVVGLVGTAVAFMVGFQNNAAYNRIWEARKIWGGIVNCSRALTVLLTTHIESDDETEKQKIIENAVAKHCAWMTALRFRLRSPRKWEVFNNAISNRRWVNKVPNHERSGNLNEELQKYLSESELREIQKKPNIATAILELQSRQLHKHRTDGRIWYFAHLDMQRKITDLIDLQGKCERIKEFPYPRQYATIGQVLVWIFILLLPYSTIPEFERIARSINTEGVNVHYVFVWASIPFITLISWIFHTMERVGRAGENPFEGTANDVPITTMTRNIEIELRSLINEEPNRIPAKIEEFYDVQM